MEFFFPCTTLNKKLSSAHITLQIKKMAFLILQYKMTKSDNFTHKIQLEITLLGGEVSVEGGKGA